MQAFMSKARSTSKALPRLITGRLVITPSLLSGMKNPSYCFRICVVAVSITSSRAATPLEFGMEMSVRSYDAVCWYENLKQFPNTHSDTYSNCQGQAAFQQNYINTDDFFKQNPDQKESSFGSAIHDEAMSGLPTKYMSDCGQYLTDAKAEPPADESDALNDGGNKYPYRAFAYCLMKSLRDTYGKEAIEAVKNEKTHSRKNWMQTLLDRDNEFRARHGVEPLQLVKDLNDGAQSWADTNANECNMHHTTEDQRLWNGKQTGESLSAGYIDDKADSAYSASDGWYEEISNYPYPTGFQGTGGDPLFEKIGHFTQTVWKDSKYVGYGFASNKGCKDKGTYTSYIAARYFPPGNGDGEYSNNVLPPK